MSHLVNKKYKQELEHLGEVLRDLAAVVQDTGNAELARTVADLNGRLHDPFMFVVVGEVKAGKSSFINALLDAGEEICKAAPEPMTDVIQQIVYGPTRTEETISPYLKKRTEPLDILKEVAIVDTPGTNTIVQHHQEITERFVPVADLIVFVFEAKNPYRQSAWDFFDFIHGEWRKKVIFVLQQKDLLPEEDLHTNIEGLRKYAKEKGIASPRIFAVSAKAELDGDYEHSGFSEVRDYIKTHVTGGRGIRMKLANYARTAENILSKVRQGVAGRRRQWERDKAFRAEITAIMDKQYRQSVNQVSLLVESTIGIYNRVTGEAEDELRTGLSIPAVFRRSFASVFGKGRPLKEWLQSLAAKMEKDLTEGLNSKLAMHLGDISDSIQQMAHLIDVKVQRSDSSLKANPEFFRSISEKRARVYQDLKETFADFLAKSDNFSGEKLFPPNKNIAPNVATGGGLAVIGVILTAFTHGAVLDITGGVLTAIGLTFAGVTVGWQRKKIMRRFRSEIGKGREQLRTELSEKLTAYISDIKTKIDQNFSGFDAMIASEEKAIEALESRLDEIEHRLQAWRADG